MLEREVKKDKQPMRQLLKHPVMKHPLVYIALFLLVAIIVVIPIAAFASTPLITEYATPNPAAGAWNITTGPDGNLWFTEKWGNKVGYIDPNTRAIKEFSLSQIDPPGYNYPMGITSGPDGNLWVADDNSGQISKITTTGNITYYPLPSNLHPTSIVTGPDGNLWFTAWYNNTIGVMSTNGTLLHQYVLGPNQLTIGGLNWLYGPMGISVGPDGNLWFAEQDSDMHSNIGNQIVKMDPSTGAVTDYPVSAPPSDTAAGPDGNTWFVLLNSSKFGKVDPGSGTVSYYNFPGTITTQSIGNYITPGPDGNVWFSVFMTGLGVVNPQTGNVTVYSTLNDAQGGPWGITSGPDKKIWYTVSSNPSQIGVADLGLTTSGSSDSGSDCKTAASDENSASGCSTTAPGQTKDTTTTTPTKKTAPVTTTSTTTVSTGISVSVESNGGTFALVPPTLVLGSISYTVPNNQVLTVDGTLGTAVADSGSTVKGSGTIFTLFVDGGAILAPGHSPGCLTDNQLTMEGTYAAQISGSIACKTYDQVVTKTSATISGKLQVSLLNGYRPKVGQTFMILNNEGKDPVQGTFTGLPEGSIVVNNDVPFTITYKGGDGNDVVLKVIANSPSIVGRTGTGKATTKASYSQRLVSFVKTHTIPIIATLTTGLVLALGGIYYLVKAHARREKTTPPVSNSIIKPSQSS
jgi:streptogramin lyase